MMKRALLLLLLTAAWAFGSWWYYTCKIKGFCRADGEVTSVSDNTIATGAATAAATGAMLANGNTDAQNTKPNASGFADQDGDAISDEDERAIGTDPTNKDSDGDGIPDNEELGVDLLTPIDTDNDGIINALDDDDDNDGILSQIETTLESNPLSADTDGDGINDGEELGNDKNNPVDSDSDGIIDLIDSIDDKATTDDSSQDATSENGTKSEPATPTAETPSPETDTANTSEQPANDDTVTVDTGTGSADQNTGDNAQIPIQKSRLYFPFRSANPGLSPAAKEYFTEVVNWLNQDTSHHVVLTGHTDDVGRAKSNLNLGLKRAVEIKDLMKQLGANPAQIEVASMGETQPIASNKTDEGRRKNRRVELIPVIK